jgi:FtsP/CotA-like multicopper oxidase with cupredoxin domain
MNMTSRKQHSFGLAFAALACVGLVASSVPNVARAAIVFQCPVPIDANGRSTDPARPNVVCKHIAAGDGWYTLGDGSRTYGFGFSDVLGIPDADIMKAGTFRAKFPAPIMVFDEGDEVYWTLSNVGMLLRPDLFDAHSIHWHGFPEASVVYDGVPHSSAVVNMGSSFTYYYKVNNPGTFMYHCHVEATEHMQMGMSGNLYVRPKQNRLPNGTVLNGGFVHQSGYQYAYNDGDGSTRYDVEAALQIGSMDSNFHNVHEAVQPLPFLQMRTDFAKLNGRGYPGTVQESPLAPPVVDGSPLPESSQPEHSVVRARAGQKVLLRLTNLNIVDYFSVRLLGLPMQVVGAGAALARGKNGSTSWSYGTNSLTLGGGEGFDVIVDTTGAKPGRYFLYTTNMNFLSNGANEDRGGMMTFIEVTP